MPSKYVYDTVWSLLNGWTPSAPTGEPGVATLAGPLISGDLEITFSTLSATPSAPSIVSVYPLDAAADVYLDSEVFVLFDKDMAPATITSGNLVLTDSLLAPVSATVSYDATTRLARIVPDVLLSASETYTLTIGVGVTDTGAVPLPAEFSSSFTTGTASISASEILGTLPHAGASSAAADGQVHILFSVAMDSSTITEYTVTVQPESELLPVPSTVSYDAATKIATSAPDTSYPSLDITVRVLGGTLPTVLDTQGNVFAQLPEPPEPWVTVHFPPADERQASLGPFNSAKRWREEGEVVILICVPSGSGSDNAYAWAEEIRTLFRGKQPNHVTFRGVDPPAAAWMDEPRGNWFALAVSARYLYDQCV